MLDIEKLRSLIVVAREGSLGRAAPLLFVTTSALSRRMAELENSIGLRLLDRTARGVQLTADGQRLIAQAECVINEFAVLEKMIADSRPETAQVRVGIGPAMSSRARASLLERVHAAKPGTDVLIIPGQNVELISMLSQGTIELALVHEPPMSTRVCSAEILRESMSVVISARHPLAGQRSIRLHELAQLPYVFASQLVSGSPRIYRDLKAALHSAGVSRVIDIGGLDIYAMRDHVAGGNGFAFTLDQPNGAEQGDAEGAGSFWDDDSVVVRRAEDLDLSASTYIAWNTSLVPPASELRRAVQQIIEAASVD